MKIAVASDHAGFRLKVELVDFLRSKGHEVIDLGPYEDTKVDYPDYARLVASKVGHKEVDRGVLICGTGLGMAVVANKFKGVRAVVALNEFMARQSRGHLDANVLCLGARVLGDELAKAILEVWLEAGFDGGRHALRLEKVQKIEEENLR